MTPTLDSRTHDDIVAECLGNMGVDEMPHGVALAEEREFLLYRFALSGREVMLKLTPADGHAGALEHARRELQFHARFAPQVPLSVPRMLHSFASEDFGICAVWTAHTPIKPAMFWMEDEYMEVVGELAQLHAAYWGRTERLAEHGFLRRATADVLEAHIRAAHAAWRELSLQERYATVLTNQAFARLRELLLNFVAIEKAVRATPITLVHGACTADALYRGASGNLVWWSWGEVGLGRAAEDLSSLLQHAQDHGGMPPLQKILMHYHTQLKLVLGDAAPVLALMRALDAAELRAKLLRAPLGLHNASVQQVADVVHRIGQLARKLNLAS